MKPKLITLTLAAADADGICEAQTPLAAGNLTINGDLDADADGIATMDVARHVSITSDGADSGRTFTVTGTDRYGNAISEAITGPASTTVAGTKNFATVSQVAVDDGTAGEITVGSADEGETPWVACDVHRNPVNIGMIVDITSGASLTYEVQCTMDNLFADGFQESDAIYTIHPDLVSKTAKDDGNYAFAVTGVRVKISGHSSGGVLFYVNQSGLLGG